MKKRQIRKNVAIFLEHFSGLYQLPDFSAAALNLCSKLTGAKAIVQQYLLPLRKNLLHKLNILHKRSFSISYIETK